MSTNHYKPIEQLNFSRKLIHILHRNGIRTVGELREIVNRGDLLTFRLVGKKLAGEINQVITEAAQKEDGEERELEQEPSIDIEKVEKKEFPAAASELKIRLGRISIEKLDLPRVIIHALHKAGVHHIGDLLLLHSSQLAQLNRIGPKSIADIQAALDKALSHPENYVQASFLQQLDPATTSNSKDSTATSVPSLPSWSDIVEPYLRSEKEARIHILLSRFGLKKKTLEELASELNITRERVRQIQVLTLSRFGRHTTYSTNAQRILNKVIQVLSTEKDELSLDSLRVLLKKTKLMGKFSSPIRTKLYNLDPFEVLICWLDILSDDRITIPPARFPIDIDDLRKAISISIKDFKLLQNIPHANKKSLLRKITFTGGIQFRDAKKILATTDEITKLVLHDLGLVQIRDDWYAPTVIVDNKYRHPIVMAANKILAAVDKIEFSAFYDGLRRFSGRFFDSIAPPDVVLYYIKLAGFEVNADFVSTPSKKMSTLSSTENCFIKTTKAHENVASFIEIAEEFRLKGFSIPAVSAVLGRSPIVDKVDIGLYKIRGTEVSWENIENAKKRQRIFAKDAKVSYGLDGTIKYKITLNSWAVYTGVISTNTIKDLAGEWSLIHCDGNKKTVNMDELFIFGLTNAISEIQGNIGERIELSFNTWNRTLTLQKVNHGEQ